MELPQCCVEAVRHQFPSPDGTYMGFRKSNDCKNEEEAAVVVITAGGAGAGVLAETLATPIAALKALNCFINEAHDIVCSIVYFQLVSRSTRFLFVSL